MTADEKRIKKWGGTTEVAKICGLHISAVSKWKVRGIPEGWKRYLMSRKRAKPVN